VAKAASKSYRITELVGERVLEFRGHDAPPRRVVVRLGQPRRAGPGSQDDWVCPYEILGMPRQLRRWAFGIDALQALSIAYHILPVELDRLARDSGGGVYHFLGGAGTFFVDGCKLVLDHISAGLAAGPPGKPRPRSPH
jgi:uncharacterized protein DUF6968